MSFRTEMRLCDDSGMVSREPVLDRRELFEPEGWTYLDRLNRLLRNTAAARGDEHARQVEQPFPCTGHAHLIGEHICCNSPAHAHHAERTA